MRSIRVPEAPNFVWRKGYSVKRLSSLLFDIICTGFSVFLLVMCLLSNIRLNQTQWEIRTLTEQISRAEEEQSLLKLRLDSSMSLSQLDAYAVNILGMQHPVQEQIIYTALP